MGCRQPIFEDSLIKGSFHRQEGGKCFGRFLEDFLRRSKGIYLFLMEEEGFASDFPPFGCFSLMALVCVLKSEAVLYQAALFYLCR